MNLKIENKGLQGYALANRAKYTDEELLIAIKTIQKALSNNRLHRAYMMKNNKKTAPNANI